ncbi:GlxA family transcriptional regulator [Rhodoferax sp.]|uniref:GlxA family transcriptional regulator n=1 Tax=Rhodoferax sp. TaxID=50421 RepID=UPI00374CC55B
MHAASAPTTEDIYFLLLPEFSVMGFVSALEPLRVANRFGGTLYRWHILSADGGAVTASNGMSLNAEGGFEAITQAPMLFVVGGFNPLEHYTPALAAWLRKLDRAGTVLGAIDTGSFLLAEAGLLQRQKLTLHWEAISAFVERYPALGASVTQELFEIDGQRITSAGGTASIDMMLALIGGKHGYALASAVSEQFVLSRIRNPSDHQRMQIAARYGIHNKKTIQVISEMERHMEEPLSTDALAGCIHVTRRQLERLFATHLKDTPSHFYLGLRLDRARQLLQQTEMRIIEVSVACGFESPSYFSRAYRSRFNSPPKQDRMGFDAAAPV